MAPSLALHGTRLILMTAGLLSAQRESSPQPDGAGIRGRDGGLRFDLAVPSGVMSEAQLAPQPRLAMLVLLTAALGGLHAVRERAVGRGTVSRLGRVVAVSGVDRGSLELGMGREPVGGRSLCDAGLRVILLLTLGYRVLLCGGGALEKVCGALSAGPHTKPATDGQGKVETGLKNASASARKDRARSPRKRETGWTWTRGTLMASQGSRHSSWSCSSCRPAMAFPALRWRIGRGLRSRESGAGDSGPRVYQQPAIPPLGEVPDVLPGWRLCQLCMSGSEDVEI